MSTSRSRRLFSAAQHSIRSLLGASGRDAAIDTLERRELLAADVLPEGSEWVRWGNGEVAALRGGYIVTFTEDLGRANAELRARDVANALGITAWDFEGIARGKWASFKTEAPITRTQIESLTTDFPFVQWVEPDQVRKSNRVPNDPAYIEQYWARNIGQTLANGQAGTAGADINVEGAWDISVGSRDVIVGIIDTGVDYNHPDLAPNIWNNNAEVAGDGIDNDGNGYVDDIRGFDFGEFDNDPMDDPTVGGHGTPVAGLVGAVGNNGQFGTGVNWLVSLLPLKIANAGGGLSTSAIVAAHDYVTDLRQRGVNVAVTNNSYGAFLPAFYDDQPDGSNAERDAIERYINSGGIFVASAGNNGQDVDNSGNAAFPASYSIPGIISVAALDPNGDLAGFSNFGATRVQVAAPGQIIYTTSTNGAAAGGGATSFFGGTSASGPIVAGAAALLKAIKPSASAVEIREVLINTSTPIASLSGKVQSGGIINVTSAAQALLAGGPVVRGFSPGPVTSNIDPSTGLPLRSVSVSFSETIATAGLNPGAVELRTDGPNNVFGDIDDSVIAISSVLRSPTDGRVVTITAGVAQFAEENYRLTLRNQNFLDPSGNRLNGNASSGTDGVLNFRVVNAGGANEPNDTLVTATPVNFDASGIANFNSLVLGDGVQTIRDVDLYRISVPGPGQISAEIIARRLPGGSSLDSVLRLFDAQGVQLATNDQFFGQDSYIDFFVNSPGTYFIGVSGFGNSGYDPNIVASGNVQSLGQYSLRLTNRTSTPDIVGYNAASNSRPGQPALPLNVPPGSLTSGTTIAQIAVADTRQILDINVAINVRHPNVSDLRISLIGPENTEVLLVGNRGGTGDDFGTRNQTGQPVLYTTFDDEQSVSITNANPPYAGNFRPEQGLSAFDGRYAAGNWTLRLQDTKELDAGALIDWNIEIRFANDIFGDFEANDTLSVATALTSVNGTGSQQTDAFIGDGGFGNLDRDLFRFTVNPGTTLNADVSFPTDVTPSLNSALRLFDTNGVQVLVSNPADRNTSFITNFVFANGGTYYLGVSESTNINYVPFTVGSGTPSVTTGRYRLTVNVTPGVSDSATTMNGDILSVGVANNATLRDTTTGTGFRRGNVDFLPSASSSFLGLTVDGFGFLNSTNQTQNPYAITNESDPRNNRVSTQTNWRGIKAQRSLTYADSDGFVAVDITLTNATSGVLNNISWAEGFNPNPGLTLDENTANTRNDVVRNGRVAVASYTNNLFLDGLFIALASPDSAAAFGSPKATVLANDVVVRDSAILAGQPSVDPNNANFDGQLALSYFIQNLQAGATATFRYFILTATSQTDLDNQLNTLNSTSGGQGHFTFSPNNPAFETIAGQNVPTYAYRVYYPEGFLGPNIFTFLPIANPNDEPARVVVIQRFEGVETAFKDRVVPAVDDLAAATGVTLVLPPRSRKGVDLNTPDLFASGAFNPAQRFRAYAVEIRSDRPIAATFSYYDLVQINAGPVAVGEAFTSQLSGSWTFGDVQQRGTENFNTGVNTYVVLQNPNVLTAKVTTRVFDVDTGLVMKTTRFVSPEGRSGVYLGGGANAPADFLFDAEGTSVEEAAPLENLLRAEYQRRGLTTAQIDQKLNSDRRYAVQVTSDLPILAAKSTFNPRDRQATGSVGTTGIGATSGVLAEGQFGLRNNNEAVGILNSSATNASVLFSFLFQNGTTLRRTVEVPAGRASTLQVSSIANFPAGQPYSVFFESNTPVTIGSTVPVSQQGVTDAFAVSSSATAFTYWGFGEGFRPGDDVDWNPNVAGVQRHPGLSENIRIYNPSSNDVTIEITFNFDLQPGTETFRRTIGGRRVAEFNIDEFITGNRRQQNQSYGIFVKAATPIVAEMNRYDLLFPGGFATLGTPLGRTAAIV
jgi:subtilisin family serine protease/subtilisin-like proprotein convertase family protein